MAELGFQFDANEVEPSAGFEAIPAGWYRVMVRPATKVKPTKAGTGEYVEIPFQVVEGEYQNRVLFARLNTKNPNEQAVKIGRAELSAFCRATGVLTPKDTAEFHNKVLMVKVAVREYQGEKQNEVKAYQSVGEYANSNHAPATVASDDNPF